MMQQYDQIFLQANLRCHLCDVSDLSLLRQVFSWSTLAAVSSTLASNLYSNTVDEWAPASYLCSVYVWDCRMNLGHFFPKMVTRHDVHWYSPVCPFYFQIKSLEMFYSIQQHDNAVSCGICNEWSSKISCLVSTLFVIFSVRSCRSHHLSLIEDENANS